MESLNLNFLLMESLILSLIIRIHVSFLMMEAFQVDFQPMMESLNLNFLLMESSILSFLMMEALKINKYFGLSARWLKFYVIKFRLFWKFVKKRLGGGRWIISEFLLGFWEKSFKKALTLIHKTSKKAKLF